MEDASATGGDDNLADGPPAQRAGNGPTLHQLRIFRAVASAETLTRAAKDLGLTQPTLSLQLGKLELTIGTRLFHRRPGEMELTEAGRFLLPHVDEMLRILFEAEDGLARFRGDHQPVIRLAGLDSVLRHVLPMAVGQVQPQFPDVSFDIRESAPAEVIELLHTRRINAGLVAANSLSGNMLGDFDQVPVMEDPYVLVVPEFLNLDGVTDPENELSAEQRQVLRRSVHFVFGSSHGTRVGDWYDRLLPGHHPIARCRSFETALSFARAGTGVCIAPALATNVLPNSAGLRRYILNVPPRRVVALVLSQQRRLEPLATLVGCLQEAGASFTFDGLLSTPPFLSASLRQRSE
ncbi:LysR family transcriptional regulator [Pseudoroseicyclus sp. H15]